MKLQPPPTVVFPGIGDLICTWFRRNRAPLHSCSSGGRREGTDVVDAPSVSCGGQLIPYTSTSCCLLRTSA